MLLVLKIRISDGEVLALRFLLSSNCATTEVSFDLYAQLCRPPSSPWAFGIQSRLQAHPTGESSARENSWEVHRMVESGRRFHFERSKCQTYPPSNNTRNIIHGKL
mmetsp:Transcript_11506/g.23417  ORF Transcript_11506/g.23417 Transcript_11506/m.23417 type:complete len:106 (+) Transcript_11506:2834-3151(+)